MDVSVFDRIKQLLDASGIEYACEHHEPTRTSEDAARVRGVELRTGAKALVLTGNKTGVNFLFVLPANLRLDSKKVKTILSETTSFAKDPLALTGCVPGSVPPFGSVIGLKTYCDLRLAENERINFNAGSLTDSVNMRYQDYVGLEKPTICNFAEV